MEASAASAVPPVEDANPR
jgi:hypothetical protein